MKKFRLFVFLIIILPLFYASCNLSNTDKDKPVKIDDATKEALKALGYIQDKDEGEMNYSW